MDLVFTPAEVLAVFLAVLITGQIASDGESNWLEGVQLAGRLPDPGDGVLLPAGSICPLS